VKTLPRSKDQKLFWESRSWPNTMCGMTNVSIYSADEHLDTDVYVVVRS